MDVLIKPLLIIFVISATFKFSIDILKFVKPKKISISKLKLLKFRKNPDDYAYYQKFLNKKKLNFFGKLRVKYLNKALIYYINDSEGNKVDFELQANYLIINAKSDSFISEKIQKKILKYNLKKILIIISFNEQYSFEIILNKLKSIINNNKNTKANNFIIINGIKEGQFEIDISNIQGNLSAYLIKILKTYSGNDFLDEYQKVKNIHNFIYDTKEAVNKNDKLIISNNYQFKIDNKKLLLSKSRVYLPFLLIIFTLGFMFAISLIKNDEKIHLPKYDNIHKNIFDYNTSFGELLRGHYINIRNNKKNEEIIKNNKKLSINKTLDFILNSKIKKVEVNNKIKLSANSSSNQVIKIGHEKYNNDIKTDISENVPFLMISMK